MNIDRVFASKKENIQPFEFNAQVAGVFDDMLNRSVPFYGELIKRQAQLTCEYYQDDSRIYDLGCSHGNLGLLILNQMKHKPFTLVGVDNSIPMIEKYAHRLKEIKGDDKSAGQVQLVCTSLTDIKINNASVVLINLTLQFVDRARRDDLICKIYKGLHPGGILLLTEKTIHSSDEIEWMQTRFYKGFKLENGYSELEISQKRDALERVLIPETVEDHKKRTLDAGFSAFDIWFKWFNFASMICIK
jgi:tRNA (cmo5U34)-methyltransferase